MAAQRCLYKGYYLTSGSIRTDSGRYQARVAITALAGEKTRSQRFLDLDEYPTEAEANERAIAGGKDWIDVQAQLEAAPAPQRRRSA